VPELGTLYAMPRSAPNWTLKQATDAIAAVTGDESPMVRRRFRHWAGLGLVSTSSISGEGVGTRRTYSTEAVLLGVILEILARRGLEGNGVRDLAKAIEAKLSREGFFRLWRDGGYLIVGFNTNGDSLSAHMTSTPTIVERAHRTQDCWVIVDVGQIATRLRSILESIG
jgi:hypothetical protein